MEKQLFISWSKPASGQIAEKFCEIVESLPLSIKCWFSQRVHDLELGSYDHKRIIAAAQESFACVSVLTPGNIQSPWIFFEAGIFYGTGKDVIGLLCCDLKHQNLKVANNPIEGYVAYANKKESFISLIKSLNIKANNISENRFVPTAERLFDEFYKTQNEACYRYKDKEISAESKFISGLLSKK